MIAFIKEFTGDHEQLQNECTQKGIRIEKLEMPTKMDKTLGTYYPMLYQLNYTKDYTDSISHLLDGKVHVFNASIGAELDDQIVKYNMRKMEIDESLKNQQIQLYTVLQPIKDPIYKMSGTGQKNYIVIKYASDCYLIADEILSDSDVELLLTGYYDKMLNINVDDLQDFQPFQKESYRYMTSHQLFKYESLKEQFPHAAEGQYKRQLQEYYQDIQEEEKPEKQLNKLNDLKEVMQFLEAQHTAYEQ